MSDYPGPLVPVGHDEPVPRRIRAFVAGRPVIDTTSARYVWEIPYYPAWNFPAGSVADGVPTRPGLLDGHVRVEWDNVDAWFEEDEQVYVHPRDPYSRVDALRSGRTVEVAVDGVTLARSSSPVLVFETKLPTRYYLPRTDVDLTRLTATATVSSCPYKGTTSQWWSVGEHADVAWSYAFPTREMLAIAGLIAFYNEKVDITVDGVRQERPSTPFG